MKHRDELEIEQMERVRMSQRTSALTANQKNPASVERGSAFFTGQHLKSGDERCGPENAAGQGGKLEGPPMSPPPTFLYTATVRVLRES